MIAIELLSNLTLLIALSVVSGFIDYRWKRDTRLGVLLQGALFGGAAIIGMLRPFVYAPGLVFDGRSVMISLGSLFFGPWAAAVTCLMTLPLRIAQGGPGVYMGVLVILCSALIGVVFHFRQGRKASEMSAKALLGFGLLVHFAMLIMTIALPSEMVLPVLKRIGWPVMLTYPLATVLIGKILNDQASRASFVQALKNSEARYRELVEHSNSVILRMTPNGTITFFNEFAQRFFGYSPGEILGRNVVGTIVPVTDSEGKSLAPVLMDIGAHPERYAVFENENIRKDGTRCWMAWTNKGILDEQGRCVAILSVGTDQTERKRAESKLQRSETLYHSLVEHIPLQIIRKDHNGRFTFANSAFCRWVGKPLEEILGKTDFDLYPRNLAEKYRQDDQRVLRGEQPYEAEEGNVLPSGEERFVRVIKIPIIDPDVGTVGVQCVFEDFTERRALEERLKQSQKLESIGQLAGGIAHDFNNIMAATMMHLSLLKLKPNLDQEMRESLRELMAEAKRAAGLTRQLLLFSRRSVMSLKVLDLNELVANLLKMLGRLIGEHIVLRFDRCSGLPLVEVDSGMIEQVLVNLAVNARDAMHKGGRLTIGTETVLTDARRLADGTEVPAGRFVCLSVADNGCGMDKATCERIFEPFFTTKEVGKGTGLGLATAYGIISQHHGWIEVESELGKGTTFRVFLPESKGVAKAESKVEETELPRGSGAVLLVEDEKGLRRAASQALRALGYQVVEARSGPEAIELWRRHEGRFDLLLSDMVMPEGMSGMDLADHLRREKPNLKVLISSGYSSEFQTHGGMDEHGYLFLPKPYELESLMKVVGRCLESGQE